MNIYGTDYDKKERLRPENVSDVDLTMHFVIEEKCESTVENDPSYVDGWRKHDSSCLQRQIRWLGDFRLLNGLAKQPDPLFEEKLYLEAIHASGLTADVDYKDACEDDEGVTNENENDDGSAKAPRDKCSTVVNNILSNTTAEYDELLKVELADLLTEDAHKGGATADSSVTYTGLNGLSWCFADAACAKEVEGIIKQLHDLTIRLRI